MLFHPFVSFAVLLTTAILSSAKQDNHRQLLQQQYIGCFRDNAQHGVMEYFHQSSGSMTVGDCIFACRELDHAFAGLEFGSECYCGDDEYASIGSASNCDMTCGGEEQCGGSFALSVYATDPARYANDFTPSPTATPPAIFKGCWKDAEDRAMEYQHEFVGFLTVPMCLQACTEYGAKFAGLEVGRQCFCGNDYGKHGSSDSCNRTCNGLACGGDWSLSVYETTNNEQVRHARNDSRNQCIATGWGDPHIITFDGLLYDAHVLSEVTMLKSRNTDFAIQARLEAVPGHNGNPAVTTGVVVKEADTSLPTIQVSLAQSSNSEHAVAFLGDDCHVQLFVDGVARDITTGTGRDDAHVTIRNQRLIKMEYPTTNLVLDMEIRIWSSACHFSIDYILMDCRPEDELVGILGSPDGNRTNDWMNEHGEPLKIPTGADEHFFEPAYDYVLENWCISSEENSHFTYESGTTQFSDFENCGKQYDPTLESIIHDAKQDPHNENIKICGEDDIGCLIEGETLGTEAAKEYLDEPAIASLPPSSTIPTESPTTEPSIAPFTVPTPVSTAVPTVKPTFSHAQEKRPPSGSRGDPHFRTWHNEHYEYHGQCDMVLVKDPNFCHGLGLQVQIRTKLVRFWSYIKSAVIRIGDDILELEGVGVDNNDNGDDDHDTKYWINFYYQGELTNIGGFPVRLHRASHARRYLTIDLSSRFPNQKIILATYREFVKVDFVNASKESFGNSVGMLGDFATGKTYGRDGITELHDFATLGREWQVLPTEDMLFHVVEQPQFPKVCIEPEDPQGQRRRRQLAENTISQDAAEVACADLKDELDRKDCVYDILATQDMDMVGAY